jgi:hypothetical protein
MGFDTFSIPPQILVALDAVEPEERAKVVQAISELRDLSPDSQSRYELERLSPEDNLYLAKPTPDIRLILRIDRIDDAKRVADVKFLDVLRQETLDKYARELADSPAKP